LPVLNYYIKRGSKAAPKHHAKKTYVIRSVKKKAPWIL